MANTFTDYPDYNFSISGITGTDSGVNTGYYYADFSGGKPVWKSIDGVYEVNFSSNRWFITNNDNNTLFRSDDSAKDVPWDEELVWESLVDEEVAAGTPIFNLVAYNKSNIVVSGIVVEEGQTDLNGTYILGAYEGELSQVAESGTINDRPVYYKLNGSESFEDWSQVYWRGDGWTIYSPEGEEDSDEFISNSNVYYPVDAEDWEKAGGGNYDESSVPVITFASTEPEPESSDAISDRNNKYTTATEAGAMRFRRLVGLGYV
jgi:hypothetical protein